MAAVRRITKEYAELQTDFPPNVIANPDENNLFHWVRLEFAPSLPLLFHLTDRIVVMVCLDG